MKFRKIVKYVIGWKYFNKKTVNMFLEDANLICLTTVKNINSFLLFSSVYSFYFNSSLKIKIR